MPLRDKIVAPSEPLWTLLSPTLVSLSSLIPERWMLCREDLAWHKRSSDTHRSARACACWSQQNPAAKQDLVMPTGALSIPEDKAKKQC